MISGDGNVKKETRNPGTFTKIHSSGTADVIITSGSNCAVTVEDDGNLFPYLEQMLKTELYKFIIRMEYL